VGYLAQGEQSESRVVLNGGRASGAQTASTRLALTGTTTSWLRCARYSLPTARGRPR
jgi:hypothetical protein